jgi:plastocyanin
MKKILGLIICMLVAIPIVSMTSGQNSTSNPISHPKTTAIHDVTIQDFSFTPTPVTIAVGDTVRWTNNGPSHHSSTSDTAIWDSGLLNVGQTFSFTFNTAGTYPYHCSLHTSMHGTVIVTSGNLPPNTPSKPTGPTTLNVGQSGSYSTSATDPNGDQVQIRFDWDATGAHNISSWSSLVPSGQTVSMSHTWNIAGTYVVEAQARDAPGNMSGWSTGLTVVVSTPGNLPPNKPTINGPTSGNKGTSYPYTAVTTDPENDNIAYFFDWGDGTNSGWTTFIPSGTIEHQNHMWSKKGTYAITVKAKDTNGGISPTTTLSVTMPLTRDLPFQPFWERLLERFPNAFPILRALRNW